ncbi:unnamed protein product [Cuscuta europaea]|uniref:Uncharacterized protein n=1 Tax=Cuscuta europaea TaxID=41803 RepID=A0A9P0YYJ9_CUSEU|nr:unnamed protein product [Cuscuta europaea]
MYRHFLLSLSVSNQHPTLTMLGANLCRRILTTSFPNHPFHCTLSYRPPRSFYFLVSAIIRLSLRQAKRFKEVVVLEFYQGVFSIHLKMTKKMLLSEETEYCCYLMYTIEDSGYSSDSSDSSFTIDTFISNVPRIGYSATRVREDGCEEIEIKSFFIKSVETGDDDMEFQASVCFPWVNLSLVIHGVEFRPRHMGQEDGRSRCSDSEISLDHLHM